MQNQTVNNQHNTQKSELIRELLSTINRMNAQEFSQFETVLNMRKHKQPMASNCGTCDHTWHVPQTPVTAKPDLCEVDYYLNELDGFYAILPFICAIVELQAMHPSAIAPYFQLITAGIVTPDGLQNLLTGMIDAIQSDGADNE